MEVLGIITLRISDPAVAKLRVNLIRDEQRAVQFQVSGCVSTVIYRIFISAHFWMNSLIKYIIF